MADPTVFLVTGNDLAQIRVKAEELVRTHAGETPDAFSLETFDEDDNTDPAKLLETVVYSMKTPGFMGRKTLWLKQFSGFDSEPAKSVKNPTPLGSAIRALTQAIEGKNDDSIIVILSGPKVDSRKTLFKTCDTKGKTLVCKKPDVSDRGWNESMTALVVQRAREKGLPLEPGVAEALVEILGTDTGRVEGELEKLWCHGLGKAVTREDLKHLCQGDGEAIFWEFTGAIGDRNLDEALSVLHTLLSATRDGESAVIGLVLSAATTLRQLLQIRILMRLKRLSATTIMNYLQGLGEEEKAGMDAYGLGDIAKLHPYRGKMMAQQALHYSETELMTGISWLRDLNQACISSSTNKRAMLEGVLLRLMSTPASVLQRR